MLQLKLHSLQRSLNLNRKLVTNSSPKLVHFLVSKCQEKPEKQSRQRDLTFVTSELTRWRSAVRARTGLPNLHGLALHSSEQILQPILRWLDQRADSASLGTQSLSFIGDSRARAVGTGLSGEARDVVGDSQARAGNQEVEIGGKDSRSHSRQRWLERAAKRGQVCGSSPHGPTIHLTRSTQRRHTNFPARRFQMMVQQIGVVQWRAEQAAIARLLDLNLVC